MKTLADFKKDLHIGMKVALIKRFGKEMNEEREVNHIQSNAFTFKKGENGKSWLEFPVASLFEYDGKSFRIYSPGERDLTPEEQQVIKNMPSRQPENRKQVERDALSDGSSTYWLDKRYTKEREAEWYWGWSKGKSYNYDTRKMRDKKVKGSLNLEYQIKGAK